MTKTATSIPTAILRLVLTLTFAITLIYSLFLVGYAWIIQDNIFNRLVADESRFIEKQFQLTGNVIQPRSGFMVLHHNWQSVPSKIQENYPRDPEQVEYTLDNGKTLHIKVIKLNDKDYILIADVAGFEVSRDFLPGILVWLVLASAFSCFIVASYAYRYAKRVTNPIKQLANHVKHQKIKVGFAEQYPDNEVKVLANDIEQSFLKLQEALDRETNFTKDVSHEIRTPISIFKNILDNNQQSQSISSQEFKQLCKVNYELEQTTQTLLALARAESKKTSDFNLAELIESCILQHFELNHSDKGQQLKLDVQLAKEILLTANKNLTTILINNLLSNLVRYASDSEVIIYADNKRLTFINTVETRLPNNITQSGVKGQHSPGIGQGLSLIARICQESHWQLDTSQKNNKFILSILF